MLGGGLKESKGRVGGQEVVDTMMTAKRAWKWDLTEMRDAAAMESQSESQAYDCLPISGFTPINGSRARQWTTESPNVIGEPRISKPNTKLRAPKSKPRKPTSKNKGRRSQTAGELQCHDIAAGLTRTKSGYSRSRLPPSEDPISCAAIPIKQNAFVDLTLCDVSESKRQRGDDSGKVFLRPSGLAERYQAAWASAKEDDVDSASVAQRGKTLANSDEKVAEDASSVTADDGQLVGIKPNTSCEPWDCVNYTYQDFATIPSAQGEGTHDGEEDPDPHKDCSIPKATLENDFNSDDIFSERDELDDCLMGSGRLTDVMQSINPSKKPEVLDGDWRLQEFKGDSLIFEDLPWEEEQRTGWSSSTAPTDKEAPISARNDGTSLRCSQFQHSVPSRILSQTSGNVSKASRTGDKALEGSQKSFDDDDLDEGLADLAFDGSDIVSARTLPASPEKPSTPKLQWMPPKTYTPAKSSQLSVSPTNLPQLVPVNKHGEAVPFTRPPFPKSIRDRSPILGLANRTVLRICFRIGEALNAAAIASRSNTDAMIELYARIILSEREANGGCKQFFQFGDLFTNKPPFLSGTYSLWKGVGLWEVDSRAFVGENGKGKMARVMGRIKKCEKGARCEMVILCIWEVDWEDVGVAKGIVCS